MAIKYRKDLTNCVAQTKVPIYKFKDRYYKVFLWKNLDALRVNVKQYDTISDDCGGYCCHAVYMQCIPEDGTGSAYTRTPRCLGEIHLLQNDWNLNIVAHECFHAANNICRVLRLGTYEDIEFEERAAYIYGNLVDTVYTWLWQVNTPKVMAKRWFWHSLIPGSVCNAFREFLSFLTRTDRKE